MTFRRQASGDHRVGPSVRAALGFLCLLGVVADSVRGQCEAAKLLPGDAQAGQRFGSAVALSEDIVVVGASDDDEGGEEAGAAYVFRRQGLMWIEEAKLLASDGEDHDWFGSATAVDGLIAVIGAWGDDDAYPGHETCNSGAAYVFRYTAGIWVEEAKLLAPEPAWGDHLGYAVAVHGDVAVLGAPCDSDNGPVAGAAYIYRCDGRAWSCEATLLAPYGNAYDYFGASVAVFGNAVVIGCRGDDDQGMDTGSVFVFRYEGSTWVQQAKLSASDAEACDEFGASVAVAGDLLAAGARWNDVHGPGSGSAYVFRFEDEQWQEEARLLASDGASEDQFGYTVATNGQAVAVGAYRDDDHGADSGSVYLFGSSEEFVGEDEG